MLTPKNIILPTFLYTQAAGGQDGIIAHSEDTVVNSKEAKQPYQLIYIRFIFDVKYLLKRILTQNMGQKGDSDFLDESQRL